jgi:hypothetical protein
VTLRKVQVKCRWTTARRSLRRDRAGTAPGPRRDRAGTAPGPFWTAPATAPATRASNPRRRRAQYIERTSEELRGTLAVPCCFAVRQCGSVEFVGRRRAHTALNDPRAP